MLGLLMVRESMLGDENWTVLSQLLEDIRKGECENVKIQTGRVEELLPLASVEYFENLDGSNILDGDQRTEQPIQEL
ncbi:MAG: hypothetical protein IE889_06505 [Campylobacterales bacterium]|nr:hypothetical protein [Campylobacterales bacterium]